MSKPDTAPETEDPVRIITDVLRQSPLLQPDEPVPDIQPLPASGSARRYFRFQRTDGTCFLGVYHADTRENAAYLDFSRQFSSKGLPVPPVLYADAARPVYFVADAGREALYDFLQRLTAGVGAPEVTEDGHPSAAAPTAENAMETVYRRVIDHLIDFQYLGGQGFDYSAAYPYAAFDEQAILADLNYFKYDFLKLAGIPFDERALEDDFRHLTAALGAAPRDVFMSRDFQSRNILLRHPLPAAPLSGEQVLDYARTVPLTFIDFQGGRRGPAAYDLATLLFEAKAKLPPALRKRLLQYYMDRTADHHPYPVGHDFEADFYGFVFLRIFQALGAYGLRGLYERKPVFLQSIPHAIANLGHLTDDGRLPDGLPEIARIIDRLRHSAWAASAPMPTNASAGTPLTVTVNSFSFRQGVPDDSSGNGGGFVFDCRGLPNPGRLPAYQTLTGRDAPVQAYLRGYGQVDRFIEQALALTAFNIEDYLARGFSHLQVNFGCTGGQHRSVYCAEEYAKRIRQRYPVQVVLRHIAHPA